MCSEINMMHCRWNFYRRLTVQSSMSSNYVASIFFLKLGEVIVEYFVYKRVFGFPLFCFCYLFMKFFLPVKNEKYSKIGKVKFHEQQIEWKKNLKTLYDKKTNFKTFDTFVFLFEIFVGSLSSSKEEMFSQK